MAIETKGKKKSLESSGMLAPGFRFHPTDEELVLYYLKRKVCGKRFRFDAISEIDIYKAEPWDLPSLSKLQSRDLEWYFFSVLDKKYGNGAKTNRATEKGYWKTTGNDRAVHHKMHVVGMKKTLVYHIGRAPKGQRTNWVMHEYRLTDLQLETAGNVQKKTFVLCRVFQKSSSGPKNGERYGAPFEEEEWDDNGFELVLKKEDEEEADFSLDACLDGNDLQEILDADIYLDTAPLPMNLQSADRTYSKENAESSDDTQKIFVGADKQYVDPDQCGNKFVSDSLAPNHMDLKQIEDEYIGECSKSENSNNLDYLLDEPFLDSSDNLQYGEGGLIEANDILNHVETDVTTFDMLDEYLKFANDDNSQYSAFDPDIMLGSEDPFPNQALLPQKEPDEGAEQAVLPSGGIIDDSKNDVVSPSDKATCQSDIQHPLTKQASQMLGNIPAPSAFAAEYPSKDAIHRLNSIRQSSGSVNITAGMIRVRNVNVAGNVTNVSSGKHESLNVILSFGFARGNDGSGHLESGASILQGKNVSTISRSWFYFIFFWITILSLSFKIATYMCAH